jgi:hypothetical protein
MREIEMHTLQEIKQAILQLPAIERESIASWLGDTAPSHSVAEPALAYGADQANRLLTAEEYLEFEQTAELRHEFVAGTLYAMSGCTRTHHRIAGNLFAAFHAHLRGGPCNAYISDFKLRLKAGQDEVFSLDDAAEFCSIGLSLPLRQMYEDVPNTRMTNPT